MNLLQASQRLGVLQERLAHGEDCMVILKEFKETLDKAIESARGHDDIDWINAGRQ